MKNEHIEFDELYRLAEIEVQGEVYSEEEKKELQHLIECEECYERYCAAALSLAALDGINAETLAVMAEKGDFEKAERKLAELGIDFSATETEKTLSGAPETEWVRGTCSFVMPAASRCARNRVGTGGRKKIGIGDFNNVPKGS